MSNEYKDWHMENIKEAFDFVVNFEGDIRRNTEDVKEYVNANKILCEEFPFLYVTDNYKYTWLDDIEPGWKKCFGLDFCIDLKEAIALDGCKTKQISGNDDPEDEYFHFLQIKEKFAALRIYANKWPENISAVMDKYEEISRYICGHCGRPAEYITSGWLYPLCSDCLSSTAYTSETATPIDAYYVSNKQKEIFNKYNLNI